MQKRRPILSALCALVLSAIILALTPLNARAAEVIASGTWGTCPWEITDDGVLTVHPGVGESQQGTNVSPWYDYGAEITSIVFTVEGGQKTVAPHDSSSLFSGLANAKTIDTTGLSVSGLTSMEFMFGNCRQLTEIDVSNWDTSSVTNMRGVFCYCFNLVQIDVSSWDTSSVTDMSRLFDGCYRLPSLDVSSWDTSSVIDMSCMFRDCKQLGSLNLSTWDTSSVTDMSSMYEFDENLTYLNVASLDTSSVINMESMFRHCESLPELHISNWDTSSVTRMNGLFDGCLHLVSIDISSWDTSSVTRMTRLFYDCYSLEYLNLADWDTSSVTDMTELFYFCESLISVDLSDWDLSLINDLGKMFYCCYSLESLNTSGWDTSSIKYMDRMFYSCRSLVELDLSGWDTSQVNSIYSMFKDCSSLVTIYVGDNWSTSSLWPNQSDVFAGCTSLVGGNGTQFDSSHVDGEYARIDLPSAPGYLSDVNGSTITSNFHFGSVNMTLNGTTYDLLATERIMDVSKKNTTFSLTAVLANDSPKALSFTLYQRDENGGTTLIAKAGTNGSFGTLSYSQFKDGQKVFVNVFDGTGQLVLTNQLLLTVKDSRKDNLPQTFVLGDGIEIPIQGWPFNGMKLKLPTGSFPITCSISENGTYRLGINIDVEKVFGDNPGFWTKLRDGSWREVFEEAVYNNYLLETGQKRLYGKPKWSVNVLGYLEGTQGSNVYKGHFALEIKWGGSWEMPVYTGYVPVCVEFSPSLKGSLSRDAAFHIEGDQLILDGTKLNFGMEGSFGVYGGIGHAALASVGVWGKGSIGFSLVLTPESSRGFEEVYISGKAGIKILFLCKSVSVTLLNSEGKKAYLYRRDTSTRQFGPAMPSYEGVIPLLEGIDTTSSYECFDRSYLSNTTNWNGSSSMGGPLLLQGGGYPYADVRMIEVDGGQLLLFLTDDGSRGSANRTQLVWSRYDASSDIWSEPVPVWEDGTADYDPSICPDGKGGAWIVWSNARVPVADDLSLEDEAALFDISIAHFDAISGSIDGFEFVTDDISFYESSPSIAASDGIPVVAWVDNPSNDLFGLNGSQHIIVASESDGSWSTREVGEESAFVISLNAGWLDGFAVSWSTDEDGSFETIEDSRVNIWTEENGLVTIGNSHAWNPVFAMSGEEPALVWCQNGVLAASKDGSSYSLTDLEYVPRTFFHLTGDIENNALLSYTRYEDELGNVYGRMAHSGEWGEEFALTSQDQSVTSWATVGSAIAPTIVYSASTETEASSADTGVWVSKGDSLAIVEVGGAWYSEGSVYIALTNGGCAPLESVSVTISEDGEVVSSDDVMIALAPGEDGYAVVPFEEPSDGAIHDFEVTVSNAAETASFTLGNPILLAEPSHGYSEEGETVSVTVTNAGGSATQPGVAIWRDIASEEVLGEVELPPLAPGESTVISFSADGMLFVDGITSTEIALNASDANGEEISSFSIVDSFAEAIDNELDENATGCGPWDISEAEIAAIRPQDYTGSPIEPKPSVRWLGKKLKLGRDYTVSYENNTEIGTATVVVTGAGVFEGTVSTTFEISRVNYDISTATVDMIDSRTYTGEPIIPDIGVTLDGTTLVEGSDYMVTFTNNVNAGYATVTITGIGSFIGTYTTGFYINEVSLVEEADVVLSGTSFPYTGEPIEPGVTITWNGVELAEGVDYRVDYYSNVEVGDAWASIQGIGNFKDWISLDFSITGSDSQKTDIGNAWIYPIPDQAYTGYEIEPELTIMHDWIELVRGVDYVVTYSDNVEVGIALVTVEGIGDYEGTAEAYFWIVGDEPFEEAFFLDADPYDDANHGAEVDWMGTSGISVGWEVSGGRVYRGLWTVKRCDFAAFLYRMADLSDDGARNDSIALTDEEVAEVLSNVKDCTPSTDHAAEIAWLISTGISRGWANSDGTVSFRPYAEVARQDMAAFLYRYADLQDDGQQNQSPIMGDQQVTFSDVRHGDDANHAAEVEWLASVGVTRGWDMGNGTYQFRGTNIVARQDMAAFMYRLYTYLLW